MLLWYNSTMTISSGQFCPNHSRAVLAAGVLASLLLGAAAVASAAPFEDGGLMGNEAWGNRKAHPAVVNAAGGVMAVATGLDLSDERPEAAAILDGMARFVSGTAD